MGVQQSGSLASLTEQRATAQKLTLFGGATSAAGQVASGISGRSAGRYNARVLLAQASQERVRGRFEERAIRASGEQVAGAQRAALAAQGVDIGSGTALELQQQTAELSERDALQARLNAALSVWGLKSQAKQERYRGELAYRAGINQALGTLLGSASDAGAFG